MSNYAEVLESIFTSEQKYTVLQLIKALINAVGELAGHTVVDVSVSQTYPSQGNPTTVTLTLTFDDDTTTNLSFTVPAGRQGIQGATGPQGKQGVGIRDVHVQQQSDDRFWLEFDLDDGTSIGTGYIALPEGPQGPQGATGAYVSDVDINNQGHLIVTLSNGNTIDAGTIDYLPDGARVRGDLSVDGEVTARIISAQAGEFQDVTAETIEQTSANYTGTLNFVTPAGISRVDCYRAFKIINGILWIIAEQKFTNTTENAIQANFQAYFDSIPSKYSSKIIRRDGTNCSQASVSDTGISNEAVVFGGVIESLSVTSAAANAINMFVYGHTIPAGATHSLSFRMPICLL